MKKLVLVLLALLAVAPAHAATWNSPAAEKTLELMFDSTGKIRLLPLRKHLTFAQMTALAGTNVANGDIRYCSNCTAAAVCASGGTGAHALRQNGVWTCAAGGGAATGDVVGPASATDNAIARFDAATGKLIQGSDAILDDTENLTGMTSIATGADPADAGALRLSNAETVCWEAAPASTDICMSVTSGETFSFTGAISAVPGITLSSGAFNTAFGGYWNGAALRPDVGNTLTLQEDGGTAALVISTAGIVSISIGLLGVVPTAQTIAAGNTITADACGGLKRITAAGAVTTSTTDTFTAPAAANAGCKMDVCNEGANAITLDDNANFHSPANADFAIGAGCCIPVASSGASGFWRATATAICND